MPHFASDEHSDSFSNQPQAVSQAAVSLSRCEQSPVALRRNVSLESATGRFIEDQQPASACAFHTRGAAVLVTTTVFECIVRAIEFTGTIEVAETSTQVLTGAMVKKVVSLDKHPYSRDTRKRSFTLLLSIAQSKPKVWIQAIAE